MSDAGAESRVAHRPRWELAGYALAACLALVPAIRMALLVGEASALQYNDYWLLIGHYTNPDGSLNVGGLFDFEYQNHPVVVPMVVYWLNIHLFAGSNIALGMFVVVIAVAILAVLGVVLFRSGLRPLEQMAILVLASCLLFTPNGAWNYVMGMSGTAWLGAGLVGIVAVYLRSRDRPVLAFLAAAVGAFTYATGLMVWPGLAAVGACRRPMREWWREWPYAVGFVANFLWYREVQTTGLGADVPWPGVIDTGRLLSRLIVFPLGLEGTVASYVGLVVLAVMVALVLWFAVVSPSATAAVWVGVTVFGLLASVSLAVGRHGWITGLGGQNRYSSVPSVALIGLSGLLVLAARQVGDRPRAEGSDVGGRVVGWAPLAAFAVVAVLAQTSGDGHVEQLRQLKSVQELREVAFHLDIVDDTPYLVGYTNVSVTQLLVGLGHQPFVDGWDLDCGLIDEQLEPEVVAATEEVGEIVSGKRRLFLLHGAPELTGVIRSDRPIDCVVIADDRGQVIGAASVGVADVPGTGGDSGATGFVAVARGGAEVYRAYVVFEDSPTPVAAGEIREADLVDE